MKSNSISIISNRRRISLSPEDILYVQLVNRQSVIHISGGKTYETYTTIDELAQQLGSGFIRADRATLVSAKGIHTIGKKIELINGELLSFTRRRKRELKEQLRAGRREIVQSLSDSDAPAMREEYRQHYASYDSAPFAFTDIEMVFNEERGGGGGSAAGGAAERWHALRARTRQGAGDRPAARHRQRHGWGAGRAKSAAELAAGAGNECEHFRQFFSGEKSASGCAARTDRDGAGEREKRICTHTAERGVYPEVEG